jgi:hypothetical protein
MFADSFCDTNWDNQSHRGWTTLLSFGLQAIAVTSLGFTVFVHARPSLTNFTASVVSTNDLTKGARNRNNRGYGTICNYCARSPTVHA